MRYLDLFAGIGGFPLGIIQAYESLHADRSKNRKGEEDPSESNEERQGLQSPESKEASTKNGRSSERSTNKSDKRPLCVGYSEIDKYATQIYQRHFPNHKNYGNIKEINAEDLPEFDLLVGGFPCQSFSIAGKRGGFDDTRGTLFFDIARIAKQRSPRLLVLENVKGLLSHDKGRTFTTIISTLDELGYDIQWQVLNSKYHGVPQNRDRVFIIGHLRGTPRPEVFPLGGGNTRHTKPDGQRGGKQVDGKDVASTLRGFGHGWQGQHNSTNAVVEPKIRKLTPTECERLQGFPDRWTEGVSDTQRYKCLGNAVTVNVVEAIFNHLSN